MTADSNLDNNSTSKFGAVAAMMLLITNTAISMMKSGFGENLIVIMRSIGPKIATLMAYVLSNNPVVDTSTSRSSANWVNNPVTTYSVIPNANVPTINIIKIRFLEAGKCIYVHTL